MFRYANPVPVAHHTHSTENIALALGYGVPVLALIRDPIDAITSSHLYRKRSLDEEVAQWLDFYTYVERVLDAIVLADFPQVVRDFNSVIRALNSRYGTDFSQISDIGAAQAAVFEDIRVHSARRGEDAYQIPIPTTERERASAECRASVLQHPRIHDARQLYAGITSRAGRSRVSCAVSSSE
jgi:hypothetical protein